MVEVLTTIAALNKISALVTNYQGYSTKKHRKKDDDNIRLAISSRLRSIKNIAQSRFDDSVKANNTDLTTAFGKLEKIVIDLEENIRWSYPSESNSINFLRKKEKKIVQEEVVLQDHAILTSLDHIKERSIKLDSNQCEHVDELCQDLSLVSMRISDRQQAIDDLVKRR